MKPADLEQVPADTTFTKKITGEAAQNCGDSCFVGIKQFADEYYARKQIMMKKIKIRQSNMISIVLLMMFLVSGMAAVQAYGQLVIYPAGGQEPEQQKKDEYECHQWAVEQTGFDPTRTQQVAQQGPAPKGGVLRGAAGGALLGAGIGAIAGDTGKGAAIGAGAGAVGGGLKQRQQQQQQTSAAQQVQASHQAQVAAYNKARAACLEGRGYTVK